MTQYSRFFAQLDGLNPLNPTAPVNKGTGLVFHGVLAIIATGLALGLILLLGARYYVRKKKQRDHRHHERGVVTTPIAALSEDEGDEEHHHHGHRRRKRRRRRVHRPRNPTLGETGGLPSPKIEPTSNPPL